MTALRPGLQRWDRQTADRVDAFFADSRHVARRIARSYRRRSRVIHPPVDCDFFTPPELEATHGGKTRARGTHSPPHESGPYLIVSALVPYKRIDRAILAANQLNKPLTIIGSGPERRRLESLAGPTVKFSGWVDDHALREAYRGARALLYPGEEDFGITALEAQACGCPVIAHARGGALETVVDGETGLFFNEPTPEALAQAIQRFESLSFDPAVCRSNAERFHRDRFRDSLVQAIDAVLKRRI